MYDICFKASLQNGIIEKNGSSKAVVLYRMQEYYQQGLILNNATPNIEVDPETYDVRVDGELINGEPLKILPMAQRYFMFWGGKK
jgi:urease subunit alpha